MSVALSIAFTGLCALVADGNGKPAQVLLVDTQGIGEVGGMVLPAHAPTLLVSLGDLANPDTSGPTQVVTGWQGTGADGAGDRGDGVTRSRREQIGLWDLRGSEVRIRVQGGNGPSGTAPLRLFQPTQEQTSWPAAPLNGDDPDAWRDPRFVADMAAIGGDGRIEPALVAEGGSGTRALPSAVAARIYLDQGLLAGGLPTEDAYRDDIFEFRSNQSEVVHRQALTDTIQWSVDTAGAAVIIEIIPVGGGQPKRLLLAPSARPHRVFVSNLPAENSSHGDAFHNMSDEELGALHFGVFYKLLLNPPTVWSLPEAWRPGSVRNGAGFIRPLLCPPARFTN